MRVRTEAKRRSIIEAAAEVFLEAGFERASMAEIAARVGGSKGTLYGYFGSKEELFLEVTLEAARSHFEPLLAALAKDTDDLRDALQRFGEKMLLSMCSEQLMQARRAIIAESGRTEMGVRFFESGPEKGMTELAQWLEQQMVAGKLRRADSLVAAYQLTALLEAETVAPALFGVRKSPTKVKIRQAVGRALDTFLGAFAARQS